MRWRHTDADLYHQWEEAEGRAEKWEKRAKEERKQHQRAITDIPAELRQEMAQMRKKLEGRIEGIVQENIELKGKKLRKDNERLECVSKMPEAHLAGNSVAVTASLTAFLR